MPDTVYIIYFAAISLIAVVVTIRDKFAAKRGARRVPEATLMLIGAAGGALAMLLTMLFIRHKTRHALFMVGLPIEIALWAALLIWLASRA